MGTEEEENPNYVGYEDVVRRKMARRDEEKESRSTLAST